MQWIADYLERLGAGGYWVVSIIVLLETLVGIGHFIPGGIFLAFVGFLCYAQVFDFPEMLFAVFVGHFAGEISNYCIGRFKGRALFHENSKYLKPQYLNAAQQRFESGGAKIIVFSQFVGLFRAFIPLAAGIAHYPIGRFLIVMGLSAFCWSVIHLGVGFVLGASWHKAAHYVESFSLFLLVFVPTVFLVGWLIRLLAQNAGTMGAWLEKGSRQIHRSQHYQNIASKSPRLFRFFEARLSLSKPWGFRATIGWIAAGALLLVYSAILFDVARADGWRFFDFAVVNLMAQLRRPVADQIFLFISHVGSGPVICVLAGLACIVCLHARQIKSMVVIVGSIVLAIVLSQVLHMVYSNNRPDITLALWKETGFSFPIGHAAVDVAALAALYHWIWNHPGRLRLRMSLAFVLLVVIILICFARMYLGVHFPSDVVAAICVGLAVVIFVGTIAQNTTRLVDIARRADNAALAIMLLGLLVTGAYYNENYIAPPVQMVKPVPLNDASTTNTLVQALPRHARGITGENVLPTNIILAGSPESVVPRLHALGWRSIEPSQFFTRQIGSPVFPAFIGGVPALYAFEMRIMNTRKLFRLWPTGNKLKGRPVWVGSVVHETREPKMMGLTAFRIHPDMDLVIDAFENDLQGLNVERVSAFRPRGLYRWKYPYFTHGDALLVQ